MRRIDGKFRIEGEKILGPKAEKMKAGKVFCRMAMLLPALASLTMVGFVVVILIPLELLTEWIERFKCKWPKWMTNLNHCSEESYQWWLEKLTFGRLKQTARRQDSHETN